MTVAILAPAPVSSGFSAGPFLLIWLGALVAGLVVSIYQVAGFAKLREDVRALERRREPVADPREAEPKDAATSPGGRMFAALYEEPEPGLFEAIRAQPLFAVTVLAALLGMVGGGLLVLQQRQVRTLALAQKQEIVGVRAAHDSLAVLVKQLRDSIATAGTTRLTSSGATPRPVAAAPAKRRVALAAQSALPPAPSINGASKAPAPRPAPSDLPPAPVIR